MLRQFIKKIPSEVEYIGGLIDDALIFLQSCNKMIDESSLFEFKVILNELVINAVKHGNNYDKEKNVKLMLIAENENKVFLCIEDEGKGFNYEKTISNEESFKDKMLLSEFGRGMLIVKSLCDEVLYNRSFDRNSIIAIKLI